MKNSERTLWITEQVGKAPKVYFVVSNAPALGEQFIKLEGRVYELA
jgi:hypothetical protein